MRKTQKMFLILFLTLCIFNVMPQNVSRADESLGNIVNGFEANVEPALENSSGIKSIVKEVLGFLQVLSGLVAVVIIAVTGMEYIIGTPQVREDIQKRMLPLVIGIVIIFGAVSITDFFVSIGEVNKTATTSGASGSSGTKTQETK